MKLLPSQKVAIAKIIEGEGFNIEQFEIKELERGVLGSPGDGVLIDYKNNNNYFFTCTLQRGYFDFYDCHLSPDENSYEGNSSGEWKEVLAQILNWLTFIKREESAEIKLQEILKLLPDQTASENNETNEKFSREDIEKLKNEMEEIKKKLNNIEEIVPDVLVKICDELDHLIEIAEILGKKDWKSLFLGTILKLKSLGLAAKTIQKIYEKIQETNIPLLN